VAWTSTLPNVALLLAKLVVPPATLTVLLVP